MQKTNSKRPALEMLFALLLFLLLIAIIATELSRASDAYFYEQAESVTFVQTDTLTGYVFREEIAADTLNNGPIEYLVPDAAPVQKGDTLAHVYRDDEKSDEGAGKREKAASLYAQIAELEATLALLDTADWKTAYLTDYDALMRELSAGNTQAALTPATLTATALGAQSAEKDRDAIEDRITALKEEVSALNANTLDHLSTTAFKDGTFYRSADGYESLFGLNQIQHLTPAALDQLLAQPPKLSGVIGKLVCRGPWYLAVPLDTAQAQAYTQGEHYPVCFDAGRADMLLERIDADDDGRALLIFHAEQSYDWLSCARKQRVRVEKSRVTGVAIPADALSEGNTVFVLQDGTARLRQVTPVLYEQGCVLIRTDELLAGECVIVSAKQLFDGKVLQ